MKEVECKHWCEKEEVLLVGVVAVQLVFNWGHSSTSLAASCKSEWELHAMMPLHPNVNRLAAQYISDVPSEMYAQLPDALQELCKFGSCALHVVPACKLRLLDCFKLPSK
jgi:hypothetical protein